MTAGFLVAAPALAALFGAPAVARDHLGISFGPREPWWVLTVAALSAVAALLRWRGWRAGQGTVGVEVLATGGFTAAIAAFVATDDEVMVALLVLVGPVAAAWVLAGLARTAASAVVPRTRPAAIGVVVASATSGIVGGAHLAAVASGNALSDVARWSVLYLGGAAIAAARASRHAPADARRAARRMSALTRPANRRRWAPLRADALTVDFGPYRILDGVSLQVDSGHVVAVVGGNGAGKSTLLRAVAGLTPLTSGRIDVAGQDVTALRADERAAAGIAFVSGARPVFAGLTVRENLRVGAYLTHRTEASFAAALGQVLTLVPAVERRLHTRAGLLSGGEQRQLAVAQTLFRRPAVLLADELALGLDVHAQAAVFDLLRALADDGIGVVVVDHDLDAVSRMADRVVAVRHGTLTEVDAGTFTDAARELLPARFLARTAR